MANDLLKIKDFGEGKLKRKNVEEFLEYSGVSRDGDALFMLQEELRREYAKRREDLYDQHRLHNDAAARKAAKEPGGVIHALNIEEQQVFRNLAKVMEAVDPERFTPTKNVVSGVSAEVQEKIEKSEREFAKSNEELSAQREEGGSTEAEMEYERELRGGKKPEKVREPNIFQRAVKRLQEVFEKLSNRQEEHDIELQEIAKTNPAQAEKEQKIDAAVLAWAEGKIDKIVYDTTKAVETVGEQTEQAREALHSPSPKVKQMLDELMADLNDAKAEYEPAPTNEKKLIELDALIAEARESLKKDEPKVQEEENISDADIDALSEEEKAKIDQELERMQAQKAAAEETSTPTPKTKELNDENAALGAELDAIFNQENSSAPQSQENPVDALNAALDAIYNPNASEKSPVESIKDPAVKDAVQNAFDKMPKAQQPSKDSMQKLVSAINNSNPDSLTKLLENQNQSLNALTVAAMRAKNPQTLKAPSIPPKPSVVPKVPPRLLSSPKRFGNRN